MSPESCPECGEELRVSERERRDGRGMCLFCGARFAVDAGEEADGPLRSQALVALRQLAVAQPRSVERRDDNRFVLAKVDVPLWPVLTFAGLLLALHAGLQLPLHLSLSLIGLVVAVLAVTLRARRGEQELRFAPGELTLAKWQVLRTREQRVTAAQIAGVDTDPAQRVVLRLTDGRAILVGMPGEGPWLVDELRRRGLAGNGKDGGGDGPGGGDAAG